MLKGHAKMRSYPEMSGYFKTSEDLCGSGRGVSLWRMRLPELETEISLFGASNHGASVGNLVSNWLGAGAALRWVEESTADEVELGPRVQ